MVEKLGSDQSQLATLGGGVISEDGATLVSSESTGESALLFGPAALREIQAGVANGSFAIPPSDSEATITADNSLPYWTYTDINSAGAITCAIVADAGAASGNVLRFTVASGTLTGKSATLTRFVPVASSASRSFSYYTEATFHNGTNSTQAEVKVSCQYYKQDGVTTTGTAFSSQDIPFSDFAAPGQVDPLGVVVPDIFGAAPDLTPATAPSDAAFIKLTITVATVATQSAARILDLTEIRLGFGSPEIILTDKSIPTDPAAVIYCTNGQLYAISPSELATLDLGDFTSLVATTSITFTAPDIVLDGNNSNWVSRITNTAAQALVNNTSTKITFNTASATPTVGSYDPQAWFDNANDNITIGQDGFYTVSANIAFVANAVGRRTLTIAVNGADAGSVNVLAAPAASTILSVSTNLYLFAGDLVTMTALQQSGGALNTVAVTGVYPALSVGRIGA